MSQNIPNFSPRDMLKPQSFRGICPKTPTRDPKANPCTPSANARASSENLFPPNILFHPSPPPHPPTNDGFFFSKVPTTLWLKGKRENQTRLPKEFCSLKGRHPHGSPSIDGVYFFKSPLDSLAKSQGAKTKQYSRRSSAPLWSYTSQTDKTPSKGQTCVGPFWTG